MDKCQHCNSDAYLNKSPEGQNCFLCGDWICDNCTDYKYMKMLYETSNKNYEGTDPICKRCSEAKILPYNY